MYCPGILYDCPYESSDVHSSLYATKKYFENTNQSVRISKYIRFYGTCKYLITVRQFTDFIIFLDRVSYPWKILHDPNQNKKKITRTGLVCKFIFLHFTNFYQNASKITLRDATMAVPMSRQRNFDR